MTDAGYTRAQIERVLLKSTLPACCRTIPRRHLATPLGTAPADSRFCAKADGFTLLYAAPGFATAFAEVVVRDRFTHKQRRRVRLVEITERAWVTVAMKRRMKLSLLDLRGDGCARLGAPTDSVRARHHAEGQALGRAIYFGHRDIDGLIFPSRLTGADVYAVFDRGIAKLKGQRTGGLSKHPELAQALSRHSIGLIAD